jgi:hypothetical protein
MEEDFSRLVQLLLVFLNNNFFLGYHKSNSTYCNTLFFALIFSKRKKNLSIIFNYFRSHPKSAVESGRRRSEVASRHLGSSRTQIQNLSGDHAG